MIKYAVFFQSKPAKITLHIAIWLSYYFFFFNITSSSSPFYISKIAIHCVLLAAFYYLNNFVLTPKLLLRNKIAIYILSVVSVIVIIVLTNYFFHGWCDNTNPHHSDHHFTQMMIRANILSALLVYAISTSVKLIGEWSRSEKEKKELEKEKLTSELSFLKSQVNPHFLLNTLNNIYALSYKKSDKAPDAIIKLSQLMRYMLYETNDKEVPLEKELNYIKNYIELQRMRISDTVKIDLNIQGDYDGIFIDPMLLVPFIENAFTHGISYNENSEITIVLTIENKQLQLVVENNFFNESSQQKDGSSGIGLVNVQKRLELIYPHKHELKIMKTGNKFKIRLTIQL